LNPGVLIHGFTRWEYDLVPDALKGVFANRDARHLLIAGFYPQRVAPVNNGYALSCFLWIQSMISSP
jgi:hypothetical protein